MRTILLLALLLAGCAESDPSGTIRRGHVTHLGEYALPPSFAVGDLVSVTDSDQVGIVVGVQSNRNDQVRSWQYDVLFQNSTILYTEDKLVLVEKFDWSKARKKGVYD